ncbi:hypothetical protein D3C80_2046640 [compost metagenome]
MPPVRVISYPATPRPPALSTEAVQVNLILSPFAVAVTFVGTEGGVVSGTGGIQGFTVFAVITPSLMVVIPFPME